MKTLDNIERISALSVQVFEQDYLLKQKPVVLTDLFASDAMNELRTIESAKIHLSSMPLEVQEEFTSSVLKTSILLDQREKKLWSFQQYLDYIEANPDTRLMATEGLTPPEIRQRFDFPDYARINGDETFSDVASLLFLGNAGNYAHLHFDGDYRQVLLHQVFGTKRVILIPANQAQKLSPIGNFSNVFLENFSESDKTAFVHYANGYDFLLCPGETVFMPAGIWHYLEYCETGMSFSVRFGRTEQLRFFGDKLHANFYLQNLATHFIAQQHPAIFEEIQSAYHKIYPTPVAKAQALQALFELIYSRLCSTSIQKMYAFTNFDAINESLLQAEAQRLYPSPVSIQSLLMGWSGF
ncbi:cupin-like domain-containing protein [Leptolyngbya sp. DQ-M1]|uniref:cupin-like domain-containing protein n=1 Tax=Leptolyngbya sp. DQ-M1 TaxID=2933920 RepID=UPI003298C323